RRSGVPDEAARADRRLDRSADPDRRPPDRRLHRALATRPRGPARRAARRLRCRSRRFLAARAVPSPPSGDPCLLDRAAAARAGLTGAAVDPELRLHPPGAAVREAVVGERRSLPCDPELERSADGSVDGADLGRVELAGGTQGMNPRTPERFVGVAVAEAG